ncbi:SAM-dependent methyltransferase [Vallitalea longa]|uniref:SAM-dependent methyltransferase n=1 Tax=Vallitalea longa TaxID=2936439 RepID=A0A9W5YCS9_9FIRM|nr:class I SAM-dependent methyltransferase [Vallitalea longa]GKX28858.1 SAM-dependent methyltransferase [Vallitalea longa]
MKQINRTQNIYDNDKFFNGYYNLRKQPNNYNILLEQPTMLELLPNVKGKSILDIGCGMGDSCLLYEKYGAKKIVGIDISSKMLEKAKKRTNSDIIDYLNIDMNSINKIDGKFDIITSSLAIHYIQDFRSLTNSIYSLLNKDGYFIFSQEHPLTTAPRLGCEYSLDDNGDVIHYNLTDYMRPGKRKVEWFVDDVIVYHRPLSEIINTLIDNNFVIMKMIESKPDDTTLQKNPNMINEFHKPSFLFVKAKKTID